jgi:uncharacterized protein (TIGR02246 family)
MAHDAAGYADMYADDVLWAPPNGPDQTSKEGIQKAVQGLFVKFAFKVDLQPEEVEVIGDFAYAIGKVDGELTPRAGGVAARAWSAEPTLPSAVFHTCRP